MSDWDVRQLTDEELDSQINKTNAHDPMLQFYLAERSRRLALISAKESNYHLGKLSRESQTIVRQNWWIIGIAALTLLATAFLVFLAVFHK